MHLIATIPGGWSPDDEGVFHVDQTPGDVVFLSAADTEILTLNDAYRDLNGAVGGALPSLRLANLLYFKQELTIDTYVEEVVEEARLVVMRLLGGAAYYRYLVEAVLEACEARGIPVLCLPGHDAPDLELLQRSRAGSGASALDVADRTWTYFVAGGRANLRHALAYLLNTFFGDALAEPLPAPPPEAVPHLFLYHPDHGIRTQAEQAARCADGRPNVAVLAYRSHYLAGNTAPIDALVRALEARGMTPVAAFALSLRDAATPEALHALLTDGGRRALHAFVNTTGFSLKRLGEEGGVGAAFFERLGVPVIQAILAASTRAAWEDGLFGLTPTDIAMNVALPEVDGRIITRPVSFKAAAGRDPATDSDIVRYETHPPGVDFVAAFAERWTRLQRLPNAQKRVALILPNYPSRDSRLANGVGLDTPESGVRLLERLEREGYTLGDDVPRTSDAVMERLVRHVTNAPESLDEREAAVALPLADFHRYYDPLPAALRERVEAQWGPPKASPSVRDGAFLLPGFRLGHTFVTVQPSRGYHLDVQATYHSPDLPPPPAYLAFYVWVEHVFRADAVVHLGKHGNLEWLPGKSLALDPRSCFPAALFGPLPHFYPFIVNDPGEGTQAKRRTHAVILDHLIPPMTRAETYGALVRLEHLIDEYYEAASLDPRRAALLRGQIADLVEETRLAVDLGLSTDCLDELLTKLDGYLCELKEAQIRDGLHVLGQAPEGEQLVDLLVALHRVPAGGTEGLTQALARDLGLDLDPLDVDFAAPFGGSVGDVRCRTLGDVVEQLERLARAQVSAALEGKASTFPGRRRKRKNFARVLDAMLRHTRPRVAATRQELDHLINGLSGAYIPSGPSGAPTRGRPDVLPTGRNFYSVDVRTIPTEAAYRLGEKAARLVIDRYLQEQGAYPSAIGLSVWGTATMRTGGDDVAQALALLGVRPVWQRANRRVADFEVLPLLQLGRPRVDVTLRISGFFRDAFPDVISLFNAAVERVARLDEPLDQNPVRRRFLAEREQWRAQGLPEEQAQARALYRVFGSKPGAYGAGLQALLDGQHWKTTDDLARAYIQWSGYAYDRRGVGHSAHETYRRRLGAMEVVLHNQDNREHDLLDSDDYYQFHGGMVAAVRSVKGAAPAAYFGDHARPEHPRIKTLQEELLKVYRSRVVNPKWITGVRRHGYKGAFEQAATMDYLFAYDATTHLVDDFLYEGITEAYLFDEANRAFLERHNPWALRDMAERMLEAVQRGLWAAPEAATVARLQELYLQADGLLEGRTGP